MHNSEHNGWPGRLSMYVNTAEVGNWLWKTGKSHSKFIHGIQVGHQNCIKHYIQSIGHQTVWWNSTKSKCSETAFPYFKWFKEEGNNDLHAACNIWCTRYQHTTVYSFSYCFRLNDDDPVRTETCWEFVILNNGGKNTVYLIGCWIH